MIRAGVDLTEYVAGVNFLAIREHDFEQLSIHLGMDRHRVECLDRSQRIDIYFEVLGHRGLRPYRHGVERQFLGGSRQGDSLGGKSSPQEELQAPNAFLLHHFQQPRTYVCP